MYIYIHVQIAALIYIYNVRIYVVYNAFFFFSGWVCGYTLRDPSTVIIIRPLLRWEKTHDLPSGYLRVCYGKLIYS